MYSVLRNHKSILISVALVGLLVSLFYLSYQFRQLILFANANGSMAIGAIGDAIEYISWILPALMAGLLIGVAAWRRKIALGYVIYLAGFYVIADFVKLLMFIFARDTLLYGYWEMIYGGGLLPVVLAGLVCLKGYYNAKRIKTTHYTIKINNLNIDGSKMRLAMISDLHLGAVAKEESIAPIMQKIIESKPDVLLLCGDIFEERTTKWQKDQALKAFKDIKLPYGMYYVPGNHEYAAQRNGTLDMDVLEGEMHKAGITMLRDQSVLLNNFYLIGRDDKDIKDRACIDELVDGLDERPKIMLDHHPVDFKQAAAAGIDLQLSGHTHGGQVFRVGRMAEWFGHSEMSYGHRAIGGFHAIVSSGVGLWGFPMRIGTPNEIAVIDLEQMSER